MSPGASQRKSDFWALCRNKEISGTAFGKQEQTLGRISLVNDHGTGRIVPLRRGGEYDINVRRSQPVEQWCSQVRVYGGNPG
jgi:hypothetical protein